MTRRIPSPADIGALVRTTRKASGLRQDELAGACGVGLRFIVDLEAGKPTAQIGKVLEHVRDETRRAPIGALIYVGDAMEENVDALCTLAGELGLLGVKAFMFHEGADPAAGQAFREIARLTGGA